MIRALTRSPGIRTAISRRRRRGSSGISRFARYAKTSSSSTRSENLPCQRQGNRLDVPRRIVLVASLIMAMLPTPRAQSRLVLIKSARVFDGDAMHEGWAVRVSNDRIDAVGPAAAVTAAGAEIVELPGTTLTPGLIEGHSHVLLHPYNETSWNDQVAREGLALRVARAVNHLRATLL